MSKKFDSYCLQLSQGDFDIINDEQILSVSHDCKLYVLDMNQSERVIQTDLMMEMNAVAIHPINNKYFVIGGADKQVNLYDNTDLSKGTLIQEFSGSIHRIKYSKDGKFIGIASEENVLNIYNSDIQRNFKCRPSHDGMIMNLCFDPHGRFVLSLGCDGKAFMFQLSDEPRLIKKYQISKDFSPQSHQYIQADWNPNGQLLALPGQSYLQLVNTEVDPEDIQKYLSVSHQNEISIVRWLNQNILITIGLDKYVKLWHYLSENNIFNLFWQVQFNEYLQQVHSTQTRLYLLDCSGTLHWTQLDKNDLITKNQPLLDERQLKENAFKDLARIKGIKDQMDEESVQIEVEEKEEKKNERKVKAQQVYEDRLEDFIDVRPQNTIQPTKTEPYRNSERIFLLHNFIGKIRSSKFMQGESVQKTIEVDFSDKLFHSPLKFDNDENFELAALNYRGLVLASRGPNNKEIEQDGYGDEEINEEPSKIYFQSLKKEVEENKFIIELQDQEGAESVCIGNDWLAVVTDIGNIKVFSFAGIELVSWRLMRPLIALCGYENLLVAAYLDSVPIFGNQMIKARIYDIEQQKILKEIEVCLSLYSDLIWLGFSEEGLLVAQDSKYIIFAYLFDQDRWVQVSKSQDKTHFWLWGVSEYTLYGYLLEEGDRYPDANEEQVHDIQEFQLKALCNFEQQQDTIQQLHLKEFIYQHETFRFKAFGYLNESRLRANDPLLRYSDSIWNQEKFQKIEKDINRLKLKTLQDLFKQNENQKFVEFFRTFCTTPQIMNATIAFLEKKNSNLVDKVKILMQERLKRIQILNTKNNITQTRQIEQIQSQQFEEQQSFGLPIANNLSSLMRQHPVKKQQIQIESQRIEYSNEDRQKDKDLLQQADQLLKSYQPEPLEEIQTENQKLEQPKDKTNPFAKKYEDQQQKDIFALSSNNDAKKRKQIVQKIEFGKQKMPEKGK